MRADGSEFPLELALSQVEGEPLLVCGALRDLTATKEAETELRHLADEQRALRHLATMVGRGVALDTVLETVCAEAGRLVAAIGVAVASRLEGGTLEERVRWRPQRATSDTSIPVTLHETIMPIFAETREWGRLTIYTDGPLSQSFLEGVEGLAELVGIAISNAVARDELLASRARIISAADVARARLQRDIHDGAQQLLVNALIHLQLATERMDVDPALARTSLRSAFDAARQGLEDLRDLSAGLHPKILTQGGLGAALDGLASRCTVPVIVDAPRRRFQQNIEAAVYFFVVEALTNIDKHARASRVQVLVEDEVSWLRVVVVDDGTGGASIDAGTGLRGLQDRVIVFGGSFEIASPPDRGTRLVGILPLGEP